MIAHVASAGPSKEEGKGGYNYDSLRSKLFLATFAKKSRDERKKKTEMDDRGGGGERSNLFFFASALTFAQ